MRIRELLQPDALSDGKGKAETPSGKEFLGGERRAGGSRWAEGKIL